MIGDITKMVFNICFSDKVRSLQFEWSPKMPGKLYGTMLSLLIIPWLWRLFLLFRSSLLSSFSIWFTSVFLTPALMTILFSFSWIFPIETSSSLLARSGADSHCSFSIWSSSSPIALHSVILLSLLLLWHLYVVLSSKFADGNLHALCLLLVSSPIIFVSPIVLFCLMCMK